jgi:hypothetical protein
MQGHSKPCSICGQALKWLQLRFWDLRMKKQCLSPGVARSPAVVAAPSLNFTTLMPCRSKTLANLSFSICRSAIQLCILSIYLIKQPGTEFGAGNVCKMSERVDPQGWDRFRNAIRGLYIANGHKLEGPDGVIKKMEERHGFKAT